MAVGGQEGGGSGVRRHGAMLAALAVFAAGGAAVAILATRSSGGQAAPLPTTAPATCDAYGLSWVKSFNKSAVADGNPTRMLSACCQSTSLKGVHHCLIRLTLAGTTVQGCALYDLGADGLPVSTKISVGRKVNCPLPTKK
jgi:hypothetical protein